MRGTSKEKMTLPINTCMGCSLPSNWLVYVIQIMLATAPGPTLDCLPLGLQVMKDVYMFNHPSIQWNAA